MMGIMIFDCNSYTDLKATVGLAVEAEWLGSRAVSVGWARGCLGSRCPLPTLLCCQAEGLVTLSLQADKRAHHNALERKRRDHIKDSFHSLRDSVPALQGEKVGKAQPGSPPGTQMMVTHVRYFCILSIVCLTVLYVECQFYCSGHLGMRAFLPWGNLNDDDYVFEYIQRCRCLLLLNVCVCISGGD